MPSTAAIGLIGAGVIGHTHSVVLQQLRSVFGERLRLVAVADPDPAARDRCADAATSRRFDFSTAQLFDSSTPPLPALR